MRILLLQPSLIVTEPFSHRAAPFLAAGLAGLAGSLRQAAHQVKIVDAYAEGWDRRGLLHDDLIEIGLPEEEVAARIRNFQPQIVGFSITFGAQMQRLKSLARWVKAIHPEIAILCGGNYASCSPSDILSIPEIDAVIIGEGEETLTLLLASLEQGEPYDEIEGIAYRSRGGSPVIKLPQSFCSNLQALAPPAFDLLPIKAYLNHLATPQFPLFGSRGCSHACATCSQRNVFGRTYRPYEADFIIQQMRHISGSYGVREFILYDHALLGDAERLDQLSDLLAGEKQKIEWIIRSSAEEPLADDRIFAKMRLSGLQLLHFDMGSGSRRIQGRVLKKNIDLYRAEEVIGKALEAGIRIACNFVLGAPGETVEEMYETLNFAWKLRSRGVQQFEFELATPYPGTDLAVQMDRMSGYASDADLLANPYERFEDSPVCSSPELMQIRDTAEREFSSRGLMLNWAHRNNVARRTALKTEERFFSSVAPAPKVRPLRPDRLNYRRSILQTR